MINTNHKIEFSPEKCVGCKLCYKACFVDVIRWDEENKRPVFKYVEDCEHCFYLSLIHICSLCLLYYSERDEIRRHTLGKEKRGIGRHD